jgi:hypothetical protein
MSQTRRTKNRWPHQTATMKNRKVAHPLAARRAGEVALRLGWSCRNGGRYDARCLPVRLAPARLGVRLAKSVPDTRDVICKAASCAGVRSAEPPAHESPPSPRVSRARRPGSLKITSSCVRHGGGAVTPTADPALALGWAVRAPACRASVPPAPHCAAGKVRRVWRKNHPAKAGGLKSVG